MLFFLQVVAGRWCVDAITDSYHESRRGSYNVQNYNGSLKHVVPFFAEEAIEDSSDWQMMRWCQVLNGAVVITELSRIVSGLKDISTGNGINAPSVRSICPDTLDSYHESKHVSYIVQHNIGSLWVGAIEGGHNSAIPHSPNPILAHISSLTHQWNC